jgi:hypothetical protein
MKPIIQEKDEQSRVIAFGTARPVDEHCPECGTLCDNDCQGYGLAYGGGCGTYSFCANEQCDWFWKILDREEVGHVNQ